MRTGIRISRGLLALLSGVALMTGILWAREGMNAAEVLPWALAFCAAFLHEAGHLIAAWGVGVRVRGLSLDLLGARMELAGAPSYGQEFFVAAGGPFVSLVCGALAFSWAARAYEGATLFCGASLVLGGINLLPVGTLDGGRMLRCGVAFLWGDRAATGALRGATGVCLGLLWTLSVYGLLRGGVGLSSFAFTLCLLERAVCGGGGEEGAEAPRGRTRERERKKNSKKTLDKRTGM